MTPVPAPQEKSVSKEIIDNNRVQESLELLNRRLPSISPSIDQEMPASTNHDANNNQSNENRMLFGTPRIEIGAAPEPSPNSLQGNLQSLTSIKQEIFPPVNSKNFY